MELKIASRYKRYIVVSSSVYINLEIIRYNTDVMNELVIFRYGQNDRHQKLQSCRQYFRQHTTEIVFRHSLLTLTSEYFNVKLLEL